MRSEVPISLAGDDQTEAEPGPTRPVEDADGEEAINEDSKGAEWRDRETEVMLENKGYL